MLYLCMPEGQGQWWWQLENNQWQSATSIEELIQAIQPVYQKKEAIVFFPQQSAQFFEQNLTKAQYKQLGQQGIQYLLEDYSIEPIEHLAIFHHFQHEQISFMALSQQVRETYQQVLALLPWQVQALLPDFLLLPEPEEGSLYIAQLGTRKLARWSALRGWNIEDVSLLKQLEIPLHSMHLFQLDDEFVETLQQQFGDELEYRIRELPQVQLIRARQHAFNALVKTKRAASSGLNYWKACAALLCAAVAVQVIFDGLRWWKYQSLATQTAALAVEQYQQWYPHESHITEQNLKKNFKSKLQLNAAADRQALQLISRVGPILQQNSLAAEQVTYQNNALSLNVLARNSETLQQLTEQFKQQGFNVELGAIRNQGSQVVGLIKVQ